MIGGEIGRPVSNSTGPGHADPDPPQPARDGLGRPRAAASNSSRPGRGRPPGPASISGGLVVVAEDPPVEGRHRDVDARRAEVGDEDVAGVGPERQLARRPAAGARPDVALDDEPALDELADALGDDRPAEAGPRDELRARSRPPEADLVEDHDERIERLVGERPADGRRVVVGHAAIIRRFDRSSSDFCT